MKIVLIVFIVLIAVGIITDIIDIRARTKDTQSRAKLIEALFANRDAQREQIKELRRENAALNHLLDLCIKQEKKKEARSHDRTENAGN